MFEVAADELVEGASQRYHFLKYILGVLRTSNSHCWGFLWGLFEHNYIHLSAYSSLNAVSIITFSILWLKRRIQIFHLHISLYAACYLLTCRSRWGDVNVVQTWFLISFLTRFGSISRFGLCVFVLVDRLKCITSLFLLHIRLKSYFKQTIHEPRLLSETNRKTSNKGH